MKSIKRTTSGRILSIYFGVSAILILIAISIAAVLLVRDYRYQEAIAKNEAMILAGTLAEHTDQVLSKFSALSKAIINDQKQAGGSAPLLSDMLRRRAAADPTVNGIAVLNKEGNVIASSDNTLEIGVDWSRSDEFVALKPTGSINYVGAPHDQSATDQAPWTKWSLNVAHRIDNPDESLSGLVIVLVDGPSISRIYQALGDNEDRIVGLVAEDGIIRISTRQAAIGRDVKAMLGDLIVKGGGFRIFQAFTSDKNYVFAFRKTRDAQILAYFGVPHSDIINAWRGFAAAVLIAVAGLSAMLAIVGVILRKLFSNRQILTRTQHKLVAAQQSRSFLEAILNTGGALVAVTDCAGRLTMVNPAFRELFGLTSECANMPEVSRELAIEKILGQRVQDLVKTLPLKTSVNIFDINERRRELSWTVTAIRNVNNTIDYLVAIGFDNTERREAELAIYQSSKLITLGEMATGLAHEINQPLATIGLSLDNLLARIGACNADWSFVEKNLHRMSEQVDRVSAIIAHMRIFGRRDTLKLAPLDPAEAIDGALTIAGAQLRQDGIVLRKQYEPGKHKVVADTTLLEQILLNIILNARDAILEGAEECDCKGRWISIRVETIGDNKETTSIIVEDSGLGVASEALDRVFEPFCTTKLDRNGTGLGLPLSYGMARELGGKINVRNTTNGAEFSILIPSAIITGSKHVEFQL